MTSSPRRVLFVCYGNICRSPMAEAILRHQLQEAGRGDLEVDSAGTHAQSGNPPHSRIRELLAADGISCRGLRSRRVTAADLQTFDRVLAMDHENLRDLQALGPARHGPELLLSYRREPGWLEVPDPYVVGGFEEVYRTLTAACTDLLAGL